MHEIGEKRKVGVDTRHPFKHHRREGTGEEVTRCASDVRGKTKEGVVGWVGGDCVIAARLIRLTVYTWVALPGILGGL